MTSILAGPIVRRVEPGGVSIWLAIDSPAEVEIRVLDDENRVLSLGRTCTTPIGSELHLVLVQTSCEDSACEIPGQQLEWGTQYQYEIQIDGDDLDVSELLYPAGPKRLSFCLPGVSLESTRLVHGSCRHPSQPGVDALSILDDLVETSFSSDAIRPQFFVCSGDLIYADSPSEVLLSLVGEVGDKLLGYRETLPGLDCSASEIPLENRKEVAGEVAGIYDPPKRQLFGFGEFLAMHLLVLSPTLWPDEVSEELRVFHSSLGKVRRALANTAFYAIFDDHEVTDDWNLTRAWSERVLSSDLGRTMVCNGMAAFALMHAWGNSPKLFSGDNPGATLLSLMQGARPDNSQLSPLLGIPEEVGDTLVPPPGAIWWHFRVETPAIDLRALDTRSMRHFPGDDPHGIPDQLSPLAIEEQLSDFNGLPVIITAAPLAPPPWTRTVMAIRKSLNRRASNEQHISDIYIPDRGDEWVPKSDVFQAVLDALPQQWVCLGGDTHIAYSALIEQESGTGAIFVSSGMKRQNRERRWRQRIGYSFPWPFIPCHPQVKTDKFALKYVRSDKGSNGKSYEYFAVNNIGSLSFTQDGDGDKRMNVIADHTVWSRSSSETLMSVPTSIPL